MVRSANVSRQTTSTIDAWKVTLEELWRSSPDQSLVFIGVGHPLRGDDYIGSHVVKEVMKRAEGRRNVHLFDAEGSVETIIAKVVELKPSHVIFIDACEMSGQPGETRLISMDQTDYPFFTTHGIPLKLLAQKILSESETWVLAIQPKQVEFSDRLSPEVQEAGKAISEYILRRLEA